ncbi:major facilitator superfamily MFS_1 [Catenulispora acidiphila DSM 44928]|uniref:Major facilitator superfamily MFS_1 n=1 Tax=Catenulispora acidiphila (strain DSM 44928 / JCM 14897 / NBRC 102108 / NRRL B-24433 / ID139908) TaxID=479433 RepID=C7PYG0_CATAD|nr:MFS transporter [Catenulispora acidiphila]ACU75450.1 major facilitator superfamily MFS_1 [Catenulispora acidiphila DSM 44928]
MGAGGGSAAAAPSRAAAGVLAATCVSAFVVNANTSAVSILLPAISADTGASLSSLQWAVTGYSLVGAAVIVTSGALGDIFGRRRIFLGGLLLFVASCAMIALAGSGGVVIAGRAIQGAAGSTILACGLSLLSAGISGQAQMRSVSLWGAASAAGAAAGPLLGGVFVNITGWQGLFWVDAGIAAACVPLTLRTVSESRDPNRAKSVDLAGTALIAAVLVPFVFAVTEGADWGWLSAATLACFAISAAAVAGFVVVEKRVRAPLIDLALLRNKYLVGASVAILVVAGCINGVMYICSLYFQNPAALGMTPLEAGFATLPAAAGIVVTAPLVTPFVNKLGARTVIAGGFGIATAGFAALIFVHASWAYAAFVAPLVVLAVGMGLANGPSSSVATNCVSQEQVGAASGISNMGRYVGAAVLTAVTAAIFNSVRLRHQAAGASAADALASGFSRAVIGLALFCAFGIVLSLLVGRIRPAGPPSAVHYAAAAAATSHTIPTTPTGPGGAPYVDDPGGRHVH